MYTAETLFRPVIKIAARVQRFPLQVSTLLSAAKLRNSRHSNFKITPFHTAQSGILCLHEIEKKEMHLFFSFPDNHELQVLVMNLRDHINNTGEILVRQLRRKDYLITKCEKLCAIITAHLQARSPKRGKYKLSVSVSN